MSTHPCRTLCRCFIAQNKTTLELNELTLSEKKKKKKTVWTCITPPLRTSKFKTHIDMVKIVYLFLIYSCVNSIMKFNHNFVKGNNIVYIYYLQDFPERNSSGELKIFPTASPKPEASDSMTLPMRNIL